MARTDIVATDPNGQVISAWETDDNGAHRLKDGAPELYDDSVVSDGPDAGGAWEPDESAAPDVIREFLAASMDEERKALAKLLKYESKVQPTLDNLRGSYEQHRDRTQRLYALATRGLARL